MTNKIALKEFKLLFPETEVTVGGQEITIKQWTIREIQKMLTKIGGLIPVMAANVYEDGKLSTMVMLTLTSNQEAFDALVDVLVMTYKVVERETFEAFDEDTFQEAVDQMITVNESFFVSKAKALKEMSDTPKKPTAKK